MATAAWKRLRHRWPAFLVVVLAPTVLDAAPDPASRRERDARDRSARRDATVRAVARVGPAVANIATEKLVERTGYRGRVLEEWAGSRTVERRASSLGSGVVIDPAGYVLTNAHVVARASRIVVTLPGTPSRDARLVSVHPVHDLALLRLPTERPLPSVALAAPRDLLVGETCIALGNPFGLENTVTRGVLSARGRKLSHEGRTLPGEFLQTDAAINPGNSGGPLLNIDGELMGLNTAVHEQGAGIGFAIPVAILREALIELTDPQRVLGLTLGVRVGDAGDDEGAEVLEVHRGGPAERAGLQVGDRIVTAGPTPVTTGFGFQLAFLSPETGSQRLALIGPDGERRGAVLSLAEPASRRLLRKRLGLVGRALTRALAWEAKTDVGSGLFVDSVEPGGPAERLGLRRGDVITNVAVKRGGRVLRRAVTGPIGLSHFISRVAQGQRISVALRRGKRGLWGDVRPR